MAELAPNTAQQTDLAAFEVETELRHHLVRVYTLMCAGLLITALVAFYLALQPEVREHVVQHPEGPEVLLLFEMIVVAFVSRAVDKMSVAISAIIFFGYAVLNGFTFAVFFIWFPPSSISYGFLIAALTFGAMALYGYNTQRDLGSLRSFFLMVLIGLALLSAINVVARNPIAYWATSYLGVMIFSGLTCYHAQNIRDLESEFEDDDRDRCKGMYASALVLYLDFVNVYMLMVRLVGMTRSRVQ